MKSILKYSFLIISALSLGSCEDWLDVNKDPNNPADVEPQYVLPVAQASVAGVVGGDFAIIGGIWSQHWTQAHVSSQYKTIEAYDLRPSSYNVAWTELYAGGLNDFEVIKRKATASGNNNLLLQAIAVQTYGYMMLADWFDQIPLMDALQFSEIKSPKYDTGPLVYTELMNRLNAALALDFTTEANEKVLTDLVFGKTYMDEIGDPWTAQDQANLWVRFVNTLKLKMYLRQTATTNPNRAASITAINTMLTSGTPFLTVPAAITQFIDEPNRSNPLFENNVRQLNVATNLRLSKTFLEYLRTNNDQVRLNAYFTAGSGGQAGLDQGDYDASSTVILPAVPSTANMSATDPFYFFSMDEVYFLLAEAYALTGNSGAAQTNYTLGVAAAYAKFGLTPGATTYPAFPVAGTVDAQQKAIIMQKWVAMFRQGYESFWDQARTGYPELSFNGNTPVRVGQPGYVAGRWTISVNSVTGTTPADFPKRLKFTASSRDVNPNTPPEKDVDEKVWWMK